MTDPAGLNGRRCLVLGGGGFIGTNLCRDLLRLVGYRLDRARAGWRPREDWLSGLRATIDWFALMQRDAGRAAQ
jgi:nucleoside-diphosphate-sugar epimerase